MKFYGNKTKSYRNPSDPISGSFCTVPVRLDFKDRDTKALAESVFRARCKANCSTPYHPALRDCIKMVSNQVRKDFPNDYVRINADAKRIGLRVFKSPPNEKKDWKLLVDLVPLPDAALDADSKALPDGTKITIPPYLVVNMPSEMDTRGRRNLFNDNSSPTRSNAAAPTATPTANSSASASNSANRSGTASVIKNV